MKSLQCTAQHFYAFHRIDQTDSFITILLIIATSRYSLQFPCKSLSFPSLFYLTPSDLIISFPTIFFRGFLFFSFHIFSYFLLDFSTILYFCFHIWAIHILSYLILFNLILSFLSLVFFLHNMIVPFLFTPPLFFSVLSTNSFY